MKRIALAAALLFAGYSPAALAQDAVVAAKNADALFTSPDPRLNTNKQVVYHIVRDLLGAGQWDKADRYIAEGYIQHNPNAASGRTALVDFFTKTLKVQPQPIPKKLGTKVIAVMAEGDLVTVLYPRTVQDPKRPGGAYTTTWFDTWRIKDGKAVEHWDPALFEEAPDLR